MNLIERPLQNEERKSDLGGAKEKGGNKSERNITSGGEDTQKEGEIIEGEW